MLAGPLVFTPKGQSYWFEGEIAVGEIVRGVVPLPPFVASPTGFEPFRSSRFPACSEPLEGKRATFNREGFPSI
jgi:hypothetical protein